MAECPPAKRGAGTVASGENGCEGCSPLLTLPSSAAAVLYESLTPAARRSLFAASRTARAFVLEHADNVTLTPHIKADPAIMGQLANSDTAPSRITLRTPIHGATNLGRYVSARPWRVVFQGCPVRPRTIEGLASFTHLTWISFVGMPLSEDGLFSALATHVPKLQGLTLTRVTRGRRAGVQSPPTPMQGVWGNGGAEAGQKQLHPLVTSLPSQLQHLEVEEVASDLFSPSAQEAITRLVVVVPQRPRHGADSEDSEDEDSEDEDEEGMPLPWQVVLCGGLPRLHTLIIQGHRGIDAAELSRVVKRCPLLKYVQLPEIRYPYNYTAEGLNGGAAGHAAAGGQQNGQGAGAGAQGGPLGGGAGGGSGAGRSTLTFSHPIHLTLTLPTDLASLLLLPLTADPPHLLSLSLPAGLIVHVEGTEEQADVLAERLLQLQLQGDPLPPEHRVPVQPVVAHSDKGMMHRTQGRQIEESDDMSCSYSGPVHIPILIVKAQLDDQNCIPSDTEPPGVCMASSLAALADYGLQRVRVCDAVLDGTFVRGCAHYLGRRLEVLEAAANVQLAPSFWATLPELPALRVLVVKDTVAIDHVLELAYKLSLRPTSSLSRPTSTNHTSSGSSSGSRQVVSCRPQQLQLCLAGTNAAWNETRLRTALQRAGRGDFISITHGWR